MGVDTQIIPLMRQVIYGTYASFATSGLSVGDLAWATDRKCLYRWSGSAWETIGISSRHGNKADIGNPANYPESSLYQADDESYLYMIVSGAWVQITFITSKGLPDWAVGDITIMSADTERSTTGTTYTKVKELSIASGGVVRVSFDLKISSGGTSAYGRIYKNGAAFGTERVTNSTTYVTYSEDLTFAISDLIQLYYKVAGAYTCSIRNFQLKADKQHIHRLILD